MDYKNGFRLVFIVLAVFFLLALALAFSVLIMAVLAHFGLLTTDHAAWAALALTMLTITFAIGAMP